MSSQLVRDAKRHPRPIICPVCKRSIQWVYFLVHLEQHFKQKPNTRPPRSA